ncbi:MAG: hypothetical protein U0269_37170 [Polyangiales bacterium]
MTRSPPLTMPTSARRIRVDWPRWSNGERVRDANAGCEPVHETRLDAANQRSEAPDRDPTFSYQPAVWIHQYPLGPISTGFGFGVHAYRVWESALAEHWSLARSQRRVCFERWFAAAPADGATSCATRELLRRAIERRPLRDCYRGASDVTVLVRAWVTRGGWIVPIEASARSEHAAIADCAGRALIGYAALEHDDAEAAETVLALRWGAAGCW